MTIVCLFFLLVSTFLDIKTAYSSALTTNSPMYCAQYCSRSSFWYYYDAVQVVPSKSGTHRFVGSSRINVDGLIYERSFDPVKPSINLLAEDADNGSHFPFELIRFLSSNETYVLVTRATLIYDTRLFSIIVSGPSIVYFTPYSKQMIS